MIAARNGPLARDRHSQVDTDVQRSAEAAPVLRRLRIPSL